MTTSNNNTAIGYTALTSGTTGYENFAGGVAALNDTTTGYQNVAVGHIAGFSVNAGARNTCLGSLAGDLITTGNNNVCIGHDVGSYTQNLTTGSNNVLVGSYCHPSGGAADTQIVMGYNVTGTGDSNFTFGKVATDSNIAFGATTITAPSDVRLKEDIQDEEIGLSFINELRPVTYLWKKAKDVPEEMKAYKADSEERVMNGKHNHGFIAQEVKEAMDKYDFKEGSDLWTEDGDDGRQRIGENALIPMLVKAIQELSAEVEKLKGA